MNKNYTKNSYERSLPLTIERVEPGSIADEIGLTRGDRIIKINAKPVVDELDYYYFTSDEYFTLEILTRENELLEVEVERESDERIGLIFKNESKTKECDNHCLFCFIDQMPSGMRETLYIKDDDERLSFLNGNYITLTNLTEDEISRIIQYKIPVNISVHTTDEKLRVKMLANKRAGEINRLLKMFSNAGIRMNIQIVLVPELNDKTLDKTIKDLSEYFPQIKSISVVPVGLTKFREGLYPFRLFTRDEARELIKRVGIYQEKFLKEYETPLVFLSDEFYLLAKEEIPPSTFYGNFSQLENGVGMVSLFREEFLGALNDETESENKKSFLLVTGELFYPVLKALLKKVKELYPDVDSEVVPVKNNFFGRTISVAGLLTGQDIINELQNYELEKFDEIILPDTVLKNDSELLLDDYTISRMSKILDKKISIVNNAQTLVKKLLGEEDG